MAELHGNTNVEVCDTCSKEYFRDFRTRNKKVFNDHNTGRFCEEKGCGGSLQDTIVNFGESLSKETLRKAV